MSDIDMDKQIAHWVGQADDDVAFVNATAGSRHAKHRAFFAELALEKMLKAHVVKATGTIPPKSHNLVRLAQLAGLQLDPEREKRYRELQAYHIDGRYGLATLSEPGVEELSRAIRDCLEEIEWLSTKLSE